jgi:tetratricopeptide (TPR) repeat protein
LADLLRERRRFDEAIQQYLVAVGTAPKDARLWSGLGLAYQGAGRASEALEAFRRAASSDPENVFAQYQLGLVSLEAKRFDEALAALRKAALKDPLRPEVISRWADFTCAGRQDAGPAGFPPLLALEPLTPGVKAVRGVVRLPCTGPVNLNSRRRGDRRMANP